MSLIRILIIAGDPLARAGLAAVLAQQPQVEIVGRLAPEDNLVDQVGLYRPEVVLWDLGWNPTTVQASLSALTDAGPAVLALVGQEGEYGVLLTAGVRGLLLRDAAAETMIAAAAAISQGLVVVAPELISVLIAPAPTTEDQPLVEPLTPRELEVLRGLADGLSNKQIGRQLAISEHTVKFHVNAILGKLGAQSRTEAVVRATRSGLILL
jgi:two-component system, NarL family, nitrate/nitrite response regulator NarL